MSIDAAPFLQDLLVTTKDGDWGKGEPSDGLLKYQVIRATDFAAASLGDMGNVPVRYLPSHTVSRRTLQENDVLIETAGGSPGRPTGRTMLITARVMEALDGPATCASFARFLRADSTRVDARYLYWFLQSMYQSGEIEQYQVQHTGVARFQYTAFASTQKIPLPPLVRQQAIAEVLGALDDKIAANTKLAAAAEALAVALLSQFQPSVALNEIVNYHKNSTNPELLEDSSVAQYSLPAFDTGQLPEESSPLDIKSSKFLIERPAVLVSKLNPRFPRIWDVSEVPSIPALASTEFLVLEPTYSSTTVLWAILSQPDFSAALESKVAGTSGSHQRVKPADLLATLVPDPRDIPTDIKDRVTSIGLRAAQTRLENAQLNATRDALLPQLMSGKLRVKDAEALVSSAV